MHRESLYATPSLLSGIARMFDFWGIFDSYNGSPDPMIADARALESDWRVVGEDLRQAIRRYEASQPSTQQLELFSSVAGENERA